MKKLVSLSFAAFALLAVLAVPAAAQPAAPAALDFDSLLAAGDCGAPAVAATAATAATPVFASRPSGGELPPLFSAACVYSKTCGGWSVSGCCSGGSARQEQKRTCEEKCCQGTLCFSSGPITETRCVSGPC